MVDSDEPFTVFGRLLVLNPSTGLFDYDDFQRQEITSDDIKDLREVSLTFIAAGRGGVIVLNFRRKGLL